MLYNSAADMIGNTPLVRLREIEEKFSLGAELYAKLEGANPTGSAKDRAALFIIEGAEREGRLAPGGLIIEPTSGNTGIALAALAAARGYRAIIVMPDTASVERRQLIAAYGAEVVLTDGSLGMKGAIAEAERLHRENSGSIIAGQFENPDNPLAHYRTTGPEIYRDTEGRLDALVAGVGTGGTLSGTGKYLREMLPDVKIVAVEPTESAVLSGGAAHPHGIQGIGAGFIPATADVKIIDEVMTVSLDEAIAHARLLARVCGILAGISSGAALAAAVRLAARTDMTGRRIAVILPDTGERYLSTGIFG